MAMSEPSLDRAMSGGAMLCFAFIIFLWYCGGEESSLNSLLDSATVVMCLLQYLVI